MSRQLPDLLADGLKVVFCGINPGMTAATAGHHFVSGSNRFWRVLHLAGFTPEQIAPAQDRSILRYGYGLTTVVTRATAAADELAPAEFTAAAAAFKRKIARHAPRFVAFLGKAAYAGLSGQRELAWGRQADTFEGAIVWILPNPSGRNRAFTLDGLVDAYRELYLEMTVASAHSARMES
ncbi:G/U mismatch-specific DNA glycosylase [Dyella japonica]|uniref:DNA glycosylase n=1 Tax=Dyella japonica DSM 16301 TaxID=1440762 RepID=A0A0G9H555_9GAMM|nr:G/U mismatch-specific DNA glycosylase [Dyella japonica]KLD62837.1 DNA glycosylase [Dyella japonica DSM 16301]